MKKITTISIFMLFAFSLSAQIKMSKKEGGILFTENSQNVLFYQIENKSLNGQFERCNYIHPIWASDGTELTEDFPEDHLHHRGIFWAWHQVWIDNQRIGDPWEIKNFDQEVSEVEFIAKKNGVGELNTEVKWKSDQWIKRNKKIPYLQENTTISIHPKIGNYRKIDFEIRLLALEENLSIGGSEDVKGYSGFSLRMKLPEDVSFSGKHGKIEPQNTAVKSEDYINISGSILQDESHGGIVIVDNPDNPGYPQKWILRKQNSMQNAAYPGNETVPVSTTKPLVLKYSLIVYSGKLNTKKIQKIIDPNK